jgi:hypothetical protein
MEIEKSGNGLRKEKIKSMIKKWKYFNDGIISQGFNHQNVYQKPQN